MPNTHPIRPFDDRDLSAVAPALFQRVMAKFTDADLDKLSDDLDFFSFAGLPSDRILALLDEVIALNGRRARSRTNAVSRAA